MPSTRSSRQVLGTESQQGVVASAQQLPLPDEREWVEATCRLDRDSSSQVLAIVGLDDGMLEVTDAWHLDIAQERLVEVAPDDVACAAPSDLSILQR